VNLLIGIVVGGVLLAVLEQRHQSISAVASLRVGDGSAPPARYPEYPSQVQAGGSMVDSLDKEAVQGAQMGANALKNVSAAIPIIGSLVAMAASTLLAAHTARLQHATSENKAVANLMPSWQADFVHIAEQYGGGAITRAQAIAGVRKLDAQTKNYLQSHVGPTGTGWYGKPTGCPGTDVAHNSCLDGGQDGSCSGPHPCTGGKSILAMGSTAQSCTVGCCIYYNYLEPAMDCLVKRIARGGHGAVNVPAIPGNKYGFPNYPSFAVQF
jgi:hypothetical protein